MLINKGFRAITEIGFKDGLLSVSQFYSPKTIFNYTRKVDPEYFLS